MKKKKHSPYAGNLIDTLYTEVEDPMKEKEKKRAAHKTIQSVDDIPPRKRH